MALRILFAISEAYPLIKTGGLADYARGLTKALVRLGHDVRLLLPCYPGTIERLAGSVERVDLGDAFSAGPTALISGRLPDTGVPLWLIECPNLYARRGGIYQDVMGDDWPDNALRFGLLARMAAWLALARGPVSWQPDVVHLNEWQTGPAAALLAQEATAPPTLFTIHNMAFQGLFNPDVLSFLGLPASVFDAQGLEYYGKVSYLKAGIRYADRIATVSEAYAREILTPEFGFGLEGLLTQRANDLVGILNGADYDVWSPQADPHVHAQFGASDIGAKKPICKDALLRRLGLAVNEGADRQLTVPMVAYMSRITHQKMADVLLDALPQVLARETQVVVLGQGDHALEAGLVALARRSPQRLAVVIGYDEELAHQILAGADMLLAPARFEPCGLTQMYALRYGTVPIVSRVGGLRETIVDARPDSLAQGTASGFVFDEPTVRGLVGGVDRALEAYRTRSVWQALQRKGMQADFSWARSARKYAQIYAALAASRLVSRMEFMSSTDADADPEHQACEHEVPQAAL
ncbi:MAG TPA: glycogen synthase GlgA [Burkholderiales bacterium]|nr:glycogen synthase GlgA [Burkholderiales bacterium]